MPPILLMFFMDGGGFAGPSYPTPGVRVLWIEADDRVLWIGEDDRVVRIDFDDRIVEV